MPNITTTISGFQGLAKTLISGLTSNVFSPDISDRYYSLWKNN